jgi:pyruvate/2-oxoglutarate dehydrogenase complex dihydrolipoamide dehydrogenase (E3) component
MVRDRVLFLDAKIKRIDIGSDNLARVLLEERPRQPKRLRVDLVLYSGGRDANTEELQCEAAGVKMGQYGRVAVDSEGRTSNEHIFAGKQYQLLHIYTYQH